MLRVAIITNVLPIYRRSFYQEVFSESGLTTTIYCQDFLKGFNLNLCHEEFYENVCIVPAWSISREQLAWQRLPMREILQKNDVFIFYGNPRVLSNVFWSILLKLFGKKVALWGQAHTAGAGKVSETFRLFWWRLFDNIFVYMDEEVDYLRNKGFKAANIVGMNNGLNQKKIEQAKTAWSAEKLMNWRSRTGLVDKRIILSCARLEEKNQFELMLSSLKEVLADFPTVIWCVIGDGLQRQYLQQLVIEKGLIDHVFWVGALYKEDELAPWFMSAEVMVHPAAIGLSILHAFGYGLPVITHDNKARHMPEFAAMEDKKTGYLYREGDIESLIKKIKLALMEEASLVSMGEYALKKVQDQYNVQVMKNRFVEFVDAASPLHERRA